MARRKAPKKFNLGAEARRLAREKSGSPPAARVIADKRRKPPKHKKKIIESELL